MRPLIMNKTNITQRIFKHVVENNELDLFELKQLFLNFISAPDVLKNNKQMNNELSEYIEYNELSTNELSTLELLKRLIDRKEESNSDDLIAYVDWKRKVGVK